MTDVPKWIEKAKETYRYHRSKLLADQSWNTVKTAKSLKRSIGSISEDLMVARFCKDGENQIIKFKNRYEGIDYIRESLKKEETMEIE